MLVDERVHVRGQPGTRNRGDRHGGPAGIEPMMQREATIAAEAILHA
ncbi:MAG: hypothetical protein IVW36_00255 [Dehalococcoidia bacterium]|nr:hypothetical protein [Dehalococcoidia bacterium]